MSTTTRAFGYFTSTILFAYGAKDGSMMPCFFCSSTILLMRVRSSGVKLLPYALIDWGSSVLSLILYAVECFGVAEKSMSPSVSVPRCLQINLFIFSITSGSPSPHPSQVMSHNGFSKSISSISAISDDFWLSSKLTTGIAENIGIANESSFSSQRKGTVPGAALSFGLEGIPCRKTSFVIPGVVVVFFVSASLCRSEFLESLCVLVFAGGSRSVVLGVFSFCSVDFCLGPFEM